MIFRGIIRMTVGSPTRIHLVTGYAVTFSNQADEGITCKLHNNKRRISKFCRQHSATTAVTKIQYLKIRTLRRNSEQS